MAYMEDCNRPLRIADFIDDTIVTDPDSPAFPTGQFRTRRTWLVGQRRVRVAKPFVV